MHPNRSTNNCDVYTAVSFLNVYQLLWFSFWYITHDFALTVQINMKIKTFWCRAPSNRALISNQEIKVGNIERIGHLPTQIQMPSYSLH